MTREADAGQQILAKALGVALEMRDHYDFDNEEQQDNLVEAIVHVVDELDFLAEDDLTIEAAVLERMQEGDLD